MLDFVFASTLDWTSVKLRVTVIHGRAMVYICPLCGHCSVCFLASLLYGSKKCDGGSKTKQCAYSDFFEKRK